EALLAAVHEERDVRVALAHALRADHALAQAVLVHERLERLADDQRRQLQLGSLGRGVDYVGRHRISARCSTLCTSLASWLGSASNQPSRISSRTASLVVRSDSASTFASFHFRAPRAVSAS